MYVRAAVVEPVGQKACWSVKSRAGGRVRRVEYKNSFLTIRSMI